jgi:NTP pyrophosphatase (non-canonical NTP hydrolase)
MNKITTKKATENDFTSLITFIDSDPDSIIWHKYPGFCPHCFGRRVYGLGLYSEKEKNKIIVRDDEVKKIIDDLKAKPKCTCLSEKLFIEGRNDPFKQFVSINVAVYAKEHPLDKPKSMNEFAEMFQHIYGDSVEAQTIEQITFHLLEETGEVATALTNLPRIHVKNLLNKKNKPTREQINEIVSTRRYYLRALAEELADVFSWINSLTIKLQRYLNCTSDLAETLHKKEAMARQIKELIERIVQEVHPVELIWRLHGEGDILVCEKCRKRPCECKPPREETLQHYIDIASEQGYNYVKRKLLTSDDILLKVLEDGSKIYDFSDVPNSDPSC